MAENETLDLGGRRWRHARAALANTDLSLAEIAKRIGDGLRSDVQSRLAKAFRSGQTLLMVTQAVGQNSVALRAAVESFQDGRLARIARDAAIAERQRRHAHEVITTFGHLTAQRTVKAPNPHRRNHPSTRLEFSP